MMSRISRSVALLLALLALLGLAAGCSDDDDGGDASGSASAASSDDGDGGDDGDLSTGSTQPRTDGNVDAPPGGEVGQDLTAQRQRYCEIWGRITALNAQPIDENDPNAVKARYNELVPIAQELEAAAPPTDNIKPAVTKLIGFLQQIAQSGDEDAVDKEANAENGKFLKNYADRWCA